MENNSTGIGTEVVLKDLPYNDKVINNKLLAKETDNDHGHDNAAGKEKVIDSEDEDTIYGIGNFKPKCLQRFATPTSYLILYCIVGILSGSYFTYLTSIMTTLEKRFAFRSKFSGMIQATDEITPLLLGVFVGYLGGRVHRPRLLSIGMMLAVSCCFLSAGPYFIYGPASSTNLENTDKSDTVNMDICDSQLPDSCNVQGRPPTIVAIMLLLIGNLLKGFGNISYYTVGLSYMDDNAKRKNTPMLLAISSAFRLLGPLVGYLQSSIFLSYYENPLVDPDFDKEDPRWIGAWWIGFILQGVLLFIFTIPLAMFPKRLPGFGKKVKKKTKFNTSRFLPTLKRLFTNKLFVLFTINNFTWDYSNAGFYMMLPKYMETQFRLSASSASLLSGPPGVAAIMVAIMLGGFIIWYWKPSPRFLIMFLIIIQGLKVFAYLLLILPHCEPIQMMNYGIADELILTDECNFGCNCTTKTFTPVCGPDKKTVFFSPCHAGCKMKENKTFTDCACVLEFNGTNTVTEGYCPDDECWSQAQIYVISMPIIELIGNTLIIAYTMILLRCVQPEDKSFALGVFEAILSGVVFIPFPIIFGAVVDSVCLVWERSCGGTGNCWFYDSKKFNHILHGSASFFLSISVAFLTALYFYRDGLQDFYEDDETEADNNTSKSRDITDKTDAHETQM